MDDLSILFIYVDIGGGGVNFCPGIQILTSVLREKKINVNLLHLNKKSENLDNYNYIYNKICDLNPNIIAFSSLTYQYDKSNEIAGFLKDRRINIPIILGGIHATICPSDLEKSNFDAFCIGEGEFPLLELFKNIKEKKDITNTPGFHFKKNGEIIKNGNGKIIENLDDLPFRSYDIVDTPYILKEKGNWFSIAFSRGCPYSCGFCINQKLKDVHYQENITKYFRCQSVERSINELVHWVVKYQNLIKIINFDDDLLMLDKKWFLEFANLYKEKIYDVFGIKYAINCRANLIDKEVTLALKKSGCHLIRIGFETGNEKMRNNILGKDITDDQLIKAFDLFNKYKIRSLAFAMIGIPGESESSIKDSLKLLVRLKPTLIRMAFFEPFIGTPLYEYCERKELFKDKRKNSENCFQETRLKFSNISEKELLLYHLIFPWYLNVLFVEEGKEMYYELINKYKNYSINQLKEKNTKIDILKDDYKLKCILRKKEISHFEYFENNNFYYHLATEFN